MLRPVVRNWKCPEDSYEDIYRFRSWNLNRFRESGRWDIAYTYYRTHPVEAIEDFLCTFDPRKAAGDNASYIPFVLFPRQREFIEFLFTIYRGGKDGLADKSREVGMTWLACAFAWHQWTFARGVKIGFGSRKADLVDKIGDPDSIFAKLRMILERVPVELHPKGWDPKIHAPLLRVINPENGNVIVGEGGRNIGRGGRSSIYFVDEAAFLDFPEDAERSLSANTNTIVWISTPPLNAGNPFVKKRFGGQIDVFSLHWTQDPRKDQGWYEKQRKRFAHDLRLLASEVDLDYEAALGDDVCIPPSWVASSKLLRAWLEQQGKLPSAESFGGVAGLDVGGNRDKSVFVARHGPLVSPSITWSDDDTTDVAAKAKEAALAARCPHINFDSIGIGRGVASALRRMPEVAAHGVNVGEKPSRKMWPDKRRADQKFANQRAELWAECRERLRLTHEHWLWVRGQGGEEHPISELLLLPDDPKLCNELSLPQRLFNEAGKMVMEAKKHMIEVRRLSSPDHADALVLSLAPIRRTVAAARTSPRY